MLKLIINADDFGYSEKVNEAIFKSFRYGILRSASLMANGKSFDHAVEMIRSNHELDIGIHLTLVKEKPVLNSEKLHSLVNDSGHFPKHAIDFAKKYFSDKISLVEVRKELTAQFEKLLDCGIKISHIDSHQHLHILPKILDIIIEMANHYNIKYIRLPKEVFNFYTMLELKPSILRLIQMATLNHFCSKAENKISFRAEFFTGFYFGGRLSKQNLITLINNLPLNGTCELMCHPGLEEFSDNFSSQYRKIEEAETLMDQEIERLIKFKNIEIASFRNLND